MSNDVKSFVFKAILAEQDLADLTKIGIEVKNLKEVEETLRVIEDDFSGVIWYNAKKMSSIYKALFSIENTIRGFIVDRLSERKGTNWWEISVPNKIKSDVDKLKSDEIKNRYMSPRSSNNIDYTLLGNLSQIIIQNWDEFSDLIPNQAWLSSRVGDLERCRNVIMHTGTLDDYDIERIEIIIRDIVRQIT
jgi:hypothetical protein